MATFAPARPSALAITLPNPVELPVTSATLSLRENNSLLMMGGGYARTTAGARITLELKGPANPSASVLRSR